MSKPKIITIDAKTTAHALFAKWMKDLKKVCGHVGHTQLNFGDENNVEVIIETDIGLWLADLMTDDLSRTQYAKVIGVTQHPGHFDWRADTYIKDAVSLHFQMHPTY